MRNEPVLNRLDISLPSPAQVRYTESDYKVLSPGQHVLCAVTGDAIPLDELRYWSWERQEAYVDCHASLQAEMAARTAARA